MGSSHFGELGLENGRSAGSSRKGKKSSNEKPKQPQRGLGVAQLEKIRLHNQMAGYLNPSPPPFHSTLNKEEDARAGIGSSSSSSSSFFPVHPNTMVGFGELDQRLDIRYSDYQSTSAVSSEFLPHQWGQQTVTLPLFEQNMEDTAQKKRRHDRCHSMSSMSQNSDSSDTQELDLELKLSL